MGPEVWDRYPKLGARTFFGGPNNKGKHFGVQIGVPFFWETAA